MTADGFKTSPDWRRFGLETQQPPGDHLSYTNEDSDADSDENELFKEEQVNGTCPHVAEPCVNHVMVDCQALDLTRCFS